VTFGCFSFRIKQLQVESFDDCGDYGNLLSPDPMHVFRHFSQLILGYHSGEVQTLCMFLGTSAN
jgi:hypothetical protein